MRYLAMSAAALAVLAYGAAVSTGPALADGVSAPMVVAQNDAKKSDSTVDKVKKEIKERHQGGEEERQENLEKADRL